MFSVLFQNVNRSCRLSRLRCANQTADYFQAHGVRAHQQLSLPSAGWAAAATEPGAVSEAAAGAPAAPAEGAYMFPDLFLSDFGGCTFFREKYVFLRVVNNSCRFFSLLQAISIEGQDSIFGPDNSLASTQNSSQAQLPETDNKLDDSIDNQQQVSLVSG